MKMRKALTVIITAAALGTAGAAAYADSPQNRPDNGAGWGPGMMGGYGPGWGMGPGMMGGNGPGWGMGPGMMGGYGPGWGRGSGMMRGYGVLSALNLTDEQRKKIEGIQDATRKKQWEVTGKMLDEASKLRDLLAANPVDRVATDAQYERLQALHKERFDIALDSRKKIMDALTAEQRERLRHYGPWWMQGGED